MDRQQAEAKIKELKDKAVRANIAYYEDANPIMSDREFDRLLEELLELELKFNLQAPDSPTVRIGGNPTKNFKNVEHPVPMLSLSNTYNKDELFDFDKRVQNILGHENYTYHVELKYDGMAMRLRYENGKLILGATRGNGTKGDDITSNVRTIRDIPLSLKNDFPDVIEIRGEAYMELDAFAKMNEDRENRGEFVFANPRNATAGTLKLQDPGIVATRPIRFFAYDVLFEDNREVHQSEKFDLLKKWGLPVCDVRKHCTSIDEVSTLIDSWADKRSTYPYETDGAVVKVNEDKYRDVLGQTAKAPRWAIAYKFESEQAITTIREITLQVGRLGTITPVAELEPVQLAGTTVKRASLHNEDEILRKDIRVGDTVVIEKAGEIIPQVIKVLNPDAENRAEPFKMPECCPACGSGLTRTEGEAAYRCTNPSCPPQVRIKIEYFASRDAMDIDGLGEAVVDQLVSNGLIQNYADLYTLEAAQISGLERMGDKSADNLIQALENAKNQPFDRVLYSLGIRFVGSKVAKDLAKAFKSMEAIAQATEDDLTAVDSIGPRIAESVVAFFKEPQNHALVNRLKEFGLKMELEETEQAGNNLDGLTFVITGTLPTLKRKEASGLIEQYGGKVTGSVSKNTNYLLAGEEAGSKLDKAKKLEIPVLSEKELFKLIGK